MTHASVRSKRMIKKKHFTTSPTHEEADGIHGHLHNWPHTLWAFFCLGRILPTSCKNHGQVARESAVRWPSRIPKSQQWGANAFGTWRPRFNNHTAPLVSLWIKSSWCCETPTKGQPCSILEGERKAKSHLKLFNILSFELGCNPIWLMWPCLILWLQTSNLLFHSSPISSTWPMSWSSSKGQKSHISSAKMFQFHHLRCTQQFRRCPALSIVVWDGSFSLAKAGNKEAFHIQLVWP